MKTGFLDLLPPERIRANVRDHYTRLATVALVLFTLLVIVAAMLLFPSYRFVTDSLHNQRAMLEKQNENNALAEPAVAKRIKDVQAEQIQMLDLKDVPSASATVRSLLDIPYRGVRLSSIAYTAPTDAKKAIVLTVSGTAENRERLQTYQQTLQAATFIASADLPISAYAKDTEIPFAIVVTLAP